MIARAGRNDPSLRGSDRKADPCHQRRAGQPAATQDMRCWRDPAAIPTRSLGVSCPVVVGASSGLRRSHLGAGRSSPWRFGRWCPD